MLDALSTASDKGLRAVDPDETARKLDAGLRKLSRQRALCRRVMGKLAQAFLERKGQHGLGFARLGDYTRERLGLSAREVQSLAAVGGALERFPLIARAFESGDISWTQARMLVAVADEETEGRWLGLARGKTVRALAAAVRDAATPTICREIDEEEQRTVDGEQRVQFRMSCGRRVKQLWREVVALARQTAGEELPVWAAADLIAAEGWSALSGEGLETSTDPEPSGEDAPVSESTPESAVAAEAFPFVDWQSIDASAPEEVDELAPGDCPLDAFELDTRMRIVMRAEQRIDWQTGRLLRWLRDLRLYRLLGFASVDRYVEERLGFSARKARALVAVDRKSDLAPELASAYREGEISWLRALALLPVVGPAHGGEWTTRARQVTARRLSEEVEWAMEMREARGTVGTVAPPPLGQRLPRPGRQMDAHPEIALRDTQVCFSGPMSVIFSLRAAIHHFRGAGGQMSEGLERLLEHVRAQWGAQPRHRDPIFERDGWRCMVPACTSRKNLHDHHSVFRSRGGDNGQDNRLAVCAWHHLRGIHQNRVRVSGKAPDGLRWELGLRPGRVPLMQTVGDCYA